MLVPVLKSEGKIQINDMTRFNAANCFATKDETAITGLEITPGVGATAIDVFDADNANWFLDWIWPDFSIDVTTDNNKIYFKLVSTGVEYTATITPGNYLLSALQAEILLQLNAVSAIVWTVGLSTKNEFLLTATEKVELQIDKLPANLLPLLYFETLSGSNAQSLSFQGGIVEALPRVISVNVINGSGNTSKDFTQKVYSIEGDALFSSDKDLITYEPAVLDYVLPGRNSFLDAHRASQEKIMNWLNQNGFQSINTRMTTVGARLKKWAVLDLEDVRLWSTFMTLHNMYIGFQNGDNDIFEAKANYYEKLMIDARNQAQLILDFDGDGKKDIEEKVSTWSGTIGMR